MITSKQQPPLAVIKLGLIASPLMFGAVTWFVHRQPSWHPAPSLPMAVRYAQVAVTVATIVAIVVMRGITAREPNDERRAHLLIVGWALGEGAALFGAVIFFLTGETQWYAFGLVALLISAAILRIRRL